MEYRATCPKCHKKISMLRILIALTPFTFKCGSCHARIYVKGIAKEIFALMFSMGMAAIFFMQYLFRSGKIDNYLYLIIPALFIIAMEIITTLLVCNKARLVVKESKKN